jgi:hypothetical protein
METLEVKRRIIDAKELEKKSAWEGDTSRIITEPTVLTENGKVVIIYGAYPGRVDDLRDACKKIDYLKSTRTGGLATESRIFGFRPRNVIRGDYCTSTSLARENPKEHEIVCRIGKEFSGLYENWAPQVYQNHKAMVDSKLLPEWKIKDTIFTSGIINRNNSLKYHFDSGNFKDCMSCMLVLKKDIEGGMLSIPEYDLRLDLQDRSYLFFDGQSLLHGVTPIKKMTKFSYRFSIVFYSLQQMCNCLPFEEELKRIRLVKKKREEKRVDINRKSL